MPNSTAGMIIGKAGNYIKQIKEESGAYVQISQKSKETNLPERCITVAGILSTAYSKPVLSGHSKIDQANFLKTNGSLMKVESIAERCLGAFCSTFDLHY